MIIETSKSIRNDNIISIEDVIINEKERTMDKIRHLEENKKEEKKLIQVKNSSEKDTDCRINDKEIVKEGLNYYLGDIRTF